MRRKLLLLNLLWSWGAMLGGPSLLGYCTELPRPTCMTSSCHATLIKPNGAGGGSLHAPIRAQGGCLVCHHSTETFAIQGGKHATFGRIEVESLNQKCVTCHDRFSGTIHSKDSAHGAIAKNGCVSCHNPHFSNQPHLLRQSSIQALCIDCHKNKVDVRPETLAGRHATQESRVTGSQQPACLKCHDPHRGGKSKTLRKDATELCLSCHQNPVERSHAQGMTAVVIPSMKGWRDAGILRHGGRKNLSCVDCHSMHSSESDHFLRGTYSPKFYGFSGAEDASACFKCHNRQLVSDEQGEIATQFRNGSANLHFLHLKNGRRGRSCRTCHRVHFATQPKLIGEWIQYGEHELPIHFNSTADGGSCVTACHGSKSYGRTQKIENSHGK